MLYVFAFLAFCGFFCAHVAHRKGRNPWLWGAAGALLPVLGVALCLMASAAPTPAATGREQVEARPRQRPRRCCGEFIPDCRGCPYFRRPLFRHDASPDERGYCEFYDRNLVDRERSGQPVERGRDESADA